MAVGYGGSRPQAEEVAGELTALGRRAIAVGGDLADPATPARIFDEVEGALGAVDVLIANAGVGGDPTGVLELSLPEWQRTLAINLTAPFLLAQRAFGGMLERGFGRIVFVSSVAAYTGGLIGAHYAASKAGLHGLAHSLARQGGGRGVTVNVVAPGLIETDMMPADPTVRERLAATRAVGRLGTAEEVAELVAAVVANAYVSNQSIVIDGGTLPT